MPITPSRLAALASGYFQDAHHASRGGSNEIITVNGRPVPPDRRGGAPSYIHRFSVQGPSHLKGWQHQNMSIGSTACQEVILSNIKGWQRQAPARCAHRSSRGGGGGGVEHQQANTIWNGIFRSGIACGRYFCAMAKPVFDNLRCNKLQNNIPDRISRRLVNHQREEHHLLHRSSHMAEA